MASEVYINIKDLPELTELNNGDYIIVETSTGTHILNFENLLIPTTNSVITTTVNQNASAFTTATTNLSSNLNSISTSVDTLSTNLISLSTSSSSISGIPDLTTNLNTLSTSYNTFKDSLTSVSNFYLAKIQITIPSGQTQGSGILTLKSGITYTINDIIISPANQYAAKFNAYPTFNVNTGLVTLQGSITKPALTVNFALSTASVTTTDLTTAEEAAIYNVFLIKT